MSTPFIDILLVEDNDDDAGLTIRALNKHLSGNHLLRLKNGQEALDYLFEKENTTLKLILLDIKMPKVDGLEVLRKVKSDPVTQQIPIVVLTSSKEENDIIESYKLGVNAYIVKPVEFEKFSVAIAEIGEFWLTHNQTPGRN